MEETVKLSLPRWFKLKWGIAACSTISLHSHCNIVFLSALGLWVDVLCLQVNNEDFAGVLVGEMDHLHFHSDRRDPFVIILEFSKLKDTDVSSRFPWSASLLRKSSTSPKVHACGLAKHSLRLNMSNTVIWKFRSRRWLVNDVPTSFIDHNPCVKAVLLFQFCLHPTGNRFVQRFYDVFFFSFFWLCLEHAGAELIGQMHASLVVTFLFLR